MQFLNRTLPNTVNALVGFGPDKGGNLRLSQAYPSEHSRVFGGAAHKTVMTDLAAPHPAAERFDAAHTRAPRLPFSLVLGSLALNLLGLALPLVILQVYDRILPNQSYATLGALLLGLGVVLLLDGLLRQARAGLGAWTAARWEHMAGCAAVTRLLEADRRAMESQPPSAHLDRLGAIEALRDYYGGQGRLVTLDLPFVAVYLLLIWAIAGALVALPIGLLVLLGMATLLAGKRLKAALAQRQTLDDRRYSFVIETLSNVGTVKTLACEGFMLRRYERLQESGAEATYGTIVWANAAQTLGTLFTGIMLSAVVSAGALLAIGGQLSLGGLAACTLLAGRAAQPVLRALGLWTQLQSLSLAREKLDTLMALPTGPVGLEAPAGRTEPLSGAISVTGLTHAFDEGAPLFHDLDIEIAPGELVAVSGDSGCGKSTLLAMLAGDLAPESGRIAYDGRTIAEDGRALRGQIALVSQSAHLFNGTILDNLTLFEDAESIDRGLAAARAIGLDEDVHGLPNGWDTRVGDGISEELPVSLRQKVAIARAIARRPRILLLDESNSALDAEADARLRAALGDLRGETTVVMVTLRPSFQRIADRHLILADGRLDRAATAMPQQTTGLAS
jgi:ATP-binding cassette subfamily C protein LapB